jgi:shikimate kinase
VTQERSIVIIGYRGSGKTTVGRRLADWLGYAFADSDAAVVERFAGMPIKQIWEQHGEPAFRQAEGQVVEELVQQPKCVIALGGGAVIDFNGSSAGREAVMSADVLRVYLQADAETLASRIAGDVHSAQSRPSLSGIASAIEEVVTVLAKREPVYRSVADVVVDVARLTPEQAVEAILNHLPD